MTEKPLHEYIDLEAYDVVPRSRYKALEEALWAIANEGVYWTGLDWTSVPSEMARAVLASDEASIHGFAGPQTVTVEGQAFPADKAPKIGDPIDVTVPWTGRGLTAYVCEVTPPNEFGIVNWTARATRGT